MQHDIDTWICIEIDRYRGLSRHWNRRAMDARKRCEPVKYRFFTMMSRHASKLAMELLGLTDDDQLYS